MRELFIDAILIYEVGELPLTEKALAAIGQKHRMKGGGLDLCSLWLPSGASERNSGVRLMLLGGLRSWRRT